MSFDPHAYRVALLEQLTAGRSSPSSPSPRQGHATPTQEEKRHAMTMSSTSGTVFDQLHTSASSASQAPPAATAPRRSNPSHDGRRGVVIDNSTLSIPGYTENWSAIPPARRQQPSHSAHRTARPSTSVDGLVQSHIQFSSPPDKQSVARAAPTATVAQDPSQAMFSILQENPHSLIADFVDRCISADVPDDVIAEHVRFMMYAMREIVTLHEALHARYQHDRVRDFELNALTNMVETQYASATRQRAESRRHPDAAFDLTPASARKSGRTVDELAPRHSPLPVPPPSAPPRGTSSQVRDDPSQTERRSLASALRHASEGVEEVEDSESRDGARARPRRARASRADRPRTATDHPSADARKGQARQRPRVIVGAKLREPDVANTPFDVGGDRGRHGHVTVRATSTSSYDPYGASFSSSSSDLDLASLQREKSNKQVRTNGLEYHHTTDPRSTQRRGSSSSPKTLRVCACCQPAAQDSRGVSHSVTRRTRAQRQPQRELLSPQRQSTRRRPTATLKPNMITPSSVAGTPGFMAPTHLSRTREKLVVQDRRAAQEEARLMAERSPPRGMSATHAAATAPTSAAMNGQVQWGPPRSTRASELRAAFISQMSSLNKRALTEDEVDTAEDVRPAGEGSSPTRGAPSPPSNLSSPPSRQAPSPPDRHRHAGGGGRSSRERSATRPPPPASQPHERDADPSFSLLDASLRSHPSSRRLSQPPRFERLDDGAQDEAPSWSARRGKDERTSVSRPAMPATTTADKRAAWHRSRTPTPPVQITSPRLQVFLERGQQKVREVERVLTQTSPVASLNSSGIASRLWQSAEPTVKPPQPAHTHATATGVLVPSEDTFPIHAPLPDRSQGVMREKDRAQTDGMQTPAITSPVTIRQDDGPVVSDQSPLVMISPTTSSSCENAWETEKEQTGRGEHAQEDTVKQPQPPEVRWRLLYGSPMRDTA